jgi:hypothetical protein
MDNSTNRQFQQQPNMLNSVAQEQQLLQQMQSFTGTPIQQPMPSVPEVPSIPEVSTVPEVPSVPEVKPQAEVVIKKEEKGIKNEYLIAPICLMFVFFIIVHPLCANLLDKYIYPLNSTKGVLTRTLIIGLSYIAIYYAVSKA